jgi:hypothetical protein
LTQLHLPRSFYAKEQPSDQLKYVHHRCCDVKCDQNAPCIENGLEVFHPQARKHREMHLSLLVVQQLSRLRARNEVQTQALDSL